MKGLLLKEFLLLKKNLIWYVLVFLFFGIMGIFAPEVSTFIPMFMSIAICGNINDDDKSKWSLYSQSLPLERKIHVKAQYNATFIFSAIATIFTALIYVISTIVTFNQFDIRQLFTLCAVSVVISLVPISVYIPFTYKFSSENGRNILIIIYFGLMFFAPTTFLLDFIDWNLGDPPAVSTSLIAMAVIIAVFLLSWFISVKIYEKKDI